MWDSTFVSRPGEYVCTSVLLSAFPDTSTRRVKTSLAGGELWGGEVAGGDRGVVSAGSCSPSPKALGAWGRGRTFSVSFPGSSASLGIQLHARKVTFDPSPSACQPSPPQLVKTPSLLRVLGEWDSPPTSSPHVSHHPTYSL